MSKDGTNRGGLRTGAGRKPKALYDKLSEGNTGHRPNKVLSCGRGDETEAPEVAGFMKEAAADEHITLTSRAEELFLDTWNWLSERNMTGLVGPHIVEQYAMAAARWQQCEELISHYGFTAKHPTTGAPIPSPYVTMAQSYCKLAQSLWYQIYQVVKDNCSEDYSDIPKNDVMDKLLRRKAE